MGSEVRKPSTDNITVDDELRKLQSEYTALHEEASQLVAERVQLESSIMKLKKKAIRLESEVALLKSPPMIIGHIQDVLDEERAIVRSSNGTIFQVSLNPRLLREKIGPGARVALNQDSLAVVEVLTDAWDPIVSGAEVSGKPDITYSEIGGLDEEIEQIREAVEWPLEKPEVFRNIGIVPPKGVLMVGPPGCGKTMLAKAVAHHTDATFIRMVGSELAQKYIGEGGRMVRELFSLAKEKAPSIIFLDEIDAIGAKRLDGATSGDREVQRTLMQLLAELDGFDNLDDVKIIAATNRPDILDDALLRPGRFDRIIEIPLPNDEARKNILNIHLSRLKTSKFSISSLVEKTAGFSGAELKAACIEAGMCAIRQNRKSIQLKDVQLSIKKVSEKRNKNLGLDAVTHLYS